MGQYFLAILLADKETPDEKESIQLYVNPHDYCQGAKLMEHSYCGHGIMNVIESLISPTGNFYKCRIVWAGDYADTEDGDENLYGLAKNSGNSFRYTVTNPQYYRYIVNHTKKMYVDKEHCTDEEEEREQDYKIHPLPLLTCEGNGRGSSDYRGNNRHLCGIWARDTISMETTIPEGYKELVCDFYCY